MKSKFVQYKKAWVFATLWLMISFQACESFLQIDVPKTELVSESLFENNAASEAAAAFLYQSIALTQAHFASGGSYSVTQLCATAADEMEYLGTVQNRIDIAENMVAPDNTYIRTFWTSAYQLIYYANNLLDGVEKSKQLSSDVKSRLSGEALFIRAFTQFYLINCFGNTPLVTSPDYQENRLITQSDSAAVYSQIKADLIRAAALLPLDFSTYGDERIRPNRWAAIALLARVSLFTHDWRNAIDYSSELIEQTSLFSLLDQTDIANAFKANNQESIWQLMPIQPHFSTYEGQNSVANNLRLTSDFISSFEDDDVRPTNWFHMGVFYKYRDGNRPASDTPHSEYSAVFRLPELYLIRAEAFLKLGQPNLQNAKADIDRLRKRAGLAPLNSIASPEELIDTIEQERRHELFYEWGHRWFDLKRWGKIDQVMKSVNDNWVPTASLWPIPEQEILTNPMLIQNIGY